jgi:putative oxidoreductase
LNCSLRRAAHFDGRIRRLLLVLCAAAIGHPYWSINDDAIARWGQFIHFWKDIELTGGALFVLARGAGPLRVDRG